MVIVIVSIILICSIVLIINYYWGYVMYYFNQGIVYKNSKENIKLKPYGVQTIIKEDDTLLFILVVTNKGMRLIYSVDYFKNECKIYKENGI